ncbi:Bifunctional riboflavin kinase/FMN adenylyltransferase [subsurface metagenome]
MTIEQELTKLAPPKETVLTIGVFDGVHEGHRYLVEKLIHRAQERDLLSGVVTFHPHPQSVLDPKNQLPYLMSLDDRVAEIRHLGVDLIASLSFTPEVARLSARQFVALLKKYLKMRGLVIGADFALGRGREGNAEKLATLGKEIRFFVDIVSPFTIDGETASSTLVRQTLTQGNMEKVTKLMRHRFSISAKVITGDKRGHALEFPTANLDIGSQQVLPGNGVYASIAHADGKQFASATNIGIRPTFGQGGKTVETYLIDYHSELYGKELKVEFIHKIRDEQRFTSPQELKSQIEKDVEKARKIVDKEMK